MSDYYVEFIIQIYEERIKLYKSACNVLLCLNEKIMHSSTAW